jgi:hypothetical protein
LDFFSSSAGDEGHVNDSTDGSGGMRVHRLTWLGARSRWPVFIPPDGEHIVFSSSSSSDSDSDHQQQNYSFSRYFINMYACSLHRLAQVAGSGTVDLLRLFVLKSISFCASLIIIHCQLGVVVFKSE